MEQEKKVVLEKKLRERDVANQMRIENDKTNALKQKAIEQEKEIEEKAVK